MNCAPSTSVLGGTGVKVPCKQIVRMEVGTSWWVMEALIWGGQKLIGHSEAKKMNSLTFISANLSSPKLFSHPWRVPVMRPSPNRNQIILSGPAQPWKISEAEDGSRPGLR